MTSTRVDELERVGIGALIQAGENGYWFTGHFGAGAIAAARLLREPELSADAAMALTAAFDDFIAAQRRWFAPIDLAKERLVPLDPVVELLREGAARMRSSGHPTIYLSAGLWALARHPDLATERTVDGLRALFASVENDDRQRYYGTPDYFPVVDAHVAESGDENVDAAIRRAFESLDHIAHDREIDGRRFFLFGDQIHLFTHAHAAVTLVELGHDDIAQETARAHVIHSRLNEGARAIEDSGGHPVSLRPTDAAFWAQPSHDLLHKVKLAEAVLGLERKLSDAERERYAPDVGRMWFWMGVRDDAPTSA